MSGTPNWILNFFDALWQMQLCLVPENSNTTPNEGYFFFFEDA